MSFETGKKCIDWIFDNVPAEKSKIEISFIGGEPFLEFEMLKKLVEYTESNKYNIPYNFFAMTNGAILTAEMKEWLAKKSDCFKLGLSLDGGKDTQDHNRSNSFDKIDIDFFTKYWKSASVKMTLSEYSFHNLAADIKFLHSKGFSIHGVNLFEGDFDWSKDEYIQILVPQFKELVDFYAEHNDLQPCQLFGRSLHNCELLSKQMKKTCGMGHETIFFDVDGQIYPCPFVTPMTFSKEELDGILQFDLTDPRNFNDQYCIDNCYIHPICSCCYAENYKLCGSLNDRNKSKCRIQKLTALFLADLHSKRILKDKSTYDNTTLYYSIDAIKKIRSIYLDEFKDYL